MVSLSTYVYHSTLQSSLDNNYIQIPLCNFHVRSPAKANKFRNKLLPNQLHRHRNLAIDTRHSYMHFLKSSERNWFQKFHCAFTPLTLNSLISTQQILFFLRKFSHLHALLEPTRLFIFRENSYLHDY